MKSNCSIDEPAGLRYSEMRQHILFILCAFLLGIMCSLTPLRAQDDDDVAVLTPDLQWRLADNAWNRRNYDDAAILCINYAEQYPDEPNVIDAWWRAYETYRAYRPHVEKRKATFEKAMAACERWEKKYADTDRERAAKAMWHRAMMVNNEGSRPVSLMIMRELVKKFPGSQQDSNAFWHLGEWLREGKEYQEAIEYYTRYYQWANYAHEYGALAALRAGWCAQELNNPTEAIKHYRHIADGKYNWGWGQVHWSALDAARRCKAMGEVELAQSLLLKIIDKVNPDSDIVKQARSEMGMDAMKITIYPHISHVFTIDNISIDGRSKINGIRDIPVLVRAGYVKKEEPFSASLTLTSKMAMTEVDPNMTATAAAGDKQQFTADIKAETQGDYWYRFKRELTSSPPNGLVVSRTWQKVGANWGESTIRIQSTARWHVWIWLPNANTNVNNLNIQPHEVSEGGKCFRWYDWFELKEGMTIKLPVEVGANVQEFYPRIRLHRNTHGQFHRDASGKGKTATFETDDFTVTLASEEEFPYTFTTPGAYDIYMNEIVK